MALAIAQHHGDIPVLCIRPACYVSAMGVTKKTVSHTLKLARWFAP